MRKPPSLDRVFLQAVKDPARREDVMNAFGLAPEQVLEVLDAADKGHTARLLNLIEKVADLPRESQTPLEFD